MIVESADSTIMSDINALSFFPTIELESIFISIWRLLFLIKIDLGASLSPVKPINWALFLSEYF